MSGRFSVEARFSGSDGVSKVVEGIERRTKRATSGIGASLKQVDAINNKIASGFADVAKQAAVVGVVVGGLLGAGLFAVMKTTNEVADAQARLATVMTTTAGFSEGASDRMKVSATEWSKVHKTTAAEFLKSSYMFVSAGMNEEQALAGAKTASLIAAATFGDAGEAAKALATQYNVLGDKARPAADEMARLGNLMTRTQQVFQFENLDQLTEGLKYGTPIAKMYGQNLETLSTVMGMLNNAGIVGTSAGTAYAAMMERLVPASKKLGFAIAHTKDGTIDFGATLTNIHDKFGDFAKASDATKVAIGEAFGRRGIVGVALLSDKAGEFSKNLAQISNNANAAGDAAAIIESKGSGPLQILENNWNDVKRATGEALNPVTGPLVSKITDITNALGTWVDKNHELIATKVQDFLKEVADNLPVIVKWAERAGRAALVIGTFMIAVKAATGAIALFNFAAATNPWVLLAIALVTLTALLVAIWPEIKKHQEIIEATAFVVGVLAVALKGQAMWTGIVTGVTAIATGASTAYAAALRAGAVAAGVMDAGLLPLLVTLGAIALAIGAVYVALKEFTELLDVSGGWAGLKAGVGSLTEGKGLFAGIDAYQNAQAKAGNPAAKASAPAASTDLVTLLQSVLTAKGAGAAPAAPGMPTLPPALTAGLPPALAGAPGADPMAALNAMLLQQGGAVVPGAAASRPAPQVASKDVAKDLADTLGPALTDALKKGKGEITVTIKGKGDASIDQQPDSGFGLRLAPSGGF